MARNTVFQVRNGGGRESFRWSGGVGELKAALSTRSGTGAASLSGEVVDPPSALGSRDGYFEKSLLPRGDAHRREFTYFVLGAGRFLYASAARLILIRVGVLYMYIYFFLDHYSMLHCTIIIIFQGVNTHGCFGPLSLSFSVRCIHECIG